MRIFFTGGTGFIGRNLIAALIKRGDEVTTISRHPDNAKKILSEKVTIISGDPAQPGSWQQTAAESDAIINLCGAPILDKKWNEKRKQLLLDSRILPTRRIVEALSQTETRPKVFISGSAMSYYGSHGDEELTESDKYGDDFSAKLCRQWEDEANKAMDLEVRLVNLRTSDVLGREGGMLSKMLPPFKFFIGGPFGNGRQYVSWIHIDDYINIVLRALVDENISGPLNMAAPNPVTNKEFAKILARVLKRPSWLPLPGFIIKLLFGEGAVLLLEGEKIIPKKVLDNGYKFKFNELEPALSNLLFRE
ncbi:MAG TPA: TIGR01777 family protein [Actinobacteria bacterium]|nr:TIGR01777 family protein [Actinomycetes bacterium]HEX21724.1 TIGR01777 family protein [Actinomycetota bacterium]